MSSVGQNVGVHHSTLPGFMKYHDSIPKIDKKQVKSTKGNYFDKREATKDIQCLGMPGVT